MKKLIILVACVLFIGCDAQVQSPVKDNANYKSYYISGFTGSRITQFEFEGVKYTIYERCDYGAILLKKENKIAR